MSEVILKVEGAAVHFPTQGGVVRALDGVSLEVRKGETFALVGESGCGKTTLARAVLGLQPLQGGRIDLLGREVKGASRDLPNRVGMVWQDPFASLDPRWPVERSVLEPGRLCGKEVDLDPLFTEVGLDPTFRPRFPHQLSGGQRQRVAIARALALKPPLVICDEPTAALDLSLRAQILNLLRDVQADMGCAFLYISHDLTTVRFLADRIAVMYLGRIVEIGPTEQVFTDPRHPYTRALLDSAPTLETLGRLPAGVVGELPDPRTKFVGCRFAPRCPNAGEDCNRADPGPTEAAERLYHCFHPVGVEAISAAK